MTWAVPGGGWLATTAYTLDGTTELDTYPVVAWVDGVAHTIGVDNTLTPVTEHACLWHPDHHAQTDVEHTAITAHHDRERRDLTALAEQVQHVTDRDLHRMTTQLLDDDPPEREPPPQPHP